MTPKEIMEAAKRLYEGVDSISGVSSARQAARTAASLCFYLAKNQLEASGATAKGLKGPPKPKAARRKPKAKPKPRVVRKKR